MNLSMFVVLLKIFENFICNFESYMKMLVLINTILLRRNMLIGIQHIEMMIYENFVSSDANIIL